MHDSDSDNYQDDSEQSWPGVMDDEEISGASDVELGTEELTFSAIANEFGSDDDADTDEDDDDDDGEDGDDESGYGTQRRTNSEYDEDMQMFNTLLGALQSQ